MTFDRAKILAEGGTYHSDANPLTECMEFRPVVSHVTVESLAPTLAMVVGLKEDATPVKRMVIEGVFQRADALNANKRVYPRGLWEKILSEDAPAMQNLKGRGMIGHLEHPESGTTDLNKGAILVTDLTLREDGVIWGKAIIYNTPEGLRLQEYLATGTRIGISSRGTGTVDSKGVVQEDYSLGTFDPVYNPSTFGAHPSPAKKATSEAVVTAPAGLPVITIPESTDPRSKPMTVAKRIQEAEALVARLTTFDRTLMDEAAVAARDAELIEARVKVAKDVSEAGAPDLVAALVSRLDAARGKLGEQIALPAGAVAGDTSSSAIARAAINLAATMQKAAGGDVTKMDTKLFQGLLIYGTGMGGIKESAAVVVEPVPGTDDPLALLGEARDTITQMAEDQETSSVIITGLREQVEGLQAVNDDTGAALATAVAVIADLTSVDHAGKVREAVEKVLAEHPTLAPFRDVLLGLRTPAAVSAKTEGILKAIAESAKVSNTGSLEERLAKVKSPAVIESVALPPKGSKAASETNAGDAAIQENLGGDKLVGKPKGAALLNAAVMNRVRESVGQA